MGAAPGSGWAGVCGKGKVAVRDYPVSSASIRFTMPFRRSTVRTSSRWSEVFTSWRLWPPAHRGSKNILFRSREELRSLNTQYPTEDATISSQISPSHILILGGGLSGLSSAFHLSRRFPYSQITLVEKTSRLGGWVHSERVKVKLGEDQDAREVGVLLEAGPRTLRPNGLAVLELIKLLNLQNSVITVPRTAPAARNRFLHLPGTHGLLPIPNSLFSLLTSPFTRVLLPAVFWDALTGSNRPSGKSIDAEFDESVDSFLARRFGSDFARTFGSALVHGIYATDARLLSMRAAFPSLYELETRGGGSVVRGAIRGAFAHKAENNNKYDTGNVESMMKSMSVFSFRDGIQTLTNALEGALKGRDNVEIVLDDEAGQLLKGSLGGGFEVITTSGRRLQSSHLVSALPLHALHSLLQRSSNPSSSSGLSELSPNLTANPSSTVIVVSFIFPLQPGAPPPHPLGFGYLVPRPFTDYGAQDQNEMGILGTVFDSCSVPEQDADPDGVPAPITKLTVMLGGPYTLSTTDLESPSFIDRLLCQLSAHLSTNLPQPLCTRIHVNQSCIPTPTVGHEKRMDELRKTVRREWGPQMEVIGAEVGGVSVSACVEAGRKVGREW
ncbi:uncharacterized protein FIBRA_02272 [Fibroporia radiculosa]|uniref:Protoporphyrinogen oxidase n=1 Tax=Fibroporia radiculosa TaxID=599839 RepID=J4G1I0_9APHY|nr:uncharacterized protein FIBRA_02272 [Fibroporia radiculosa]CCM00243.1 predicted protein [Fibroporia radiculosa]